MGGPEGEGKEFCTHSTSTISWAEDGEFRKGGDTEGNTAQTGKESQRMDFQL